MKNQKLFIFTLTMIISVSFIKNILCDFNNLNTNTNTDTNTNRLTYENKPSIITQELVYSDCDENESLETCISKATCCHITISKRNFKYSACVDALSEQNFQTLCKKFYEYAGGNGFYGSECRCKNFNDSISTFYQISYLWLILTIGIFLVGVV